MTYMAVEAVTAGLCLTGLVHADPHEGNIMLADNGDLVFLDFGLMSRVDADICEAFAAVWKSTSVSGAPDNSSLSHFFGDGVAVLARSSGKERAPPRYRADVASMA